MSSDHEPDAPGPGVVTRLPMAKARFHRRLKAASAPAEKRD